MATLWPSEWPASAGLHAWTTGAIGLMTLELVLMIVATESYHRPA